MSQVHLEGHGHDRPARPKRAGRLTLLLSALTFALTATTAPVHAAGAQYATAAAVAQPVIYFGSGARTSHLAAEMNTDALSPEQAEAAGVRFITCFVGFTTGRANTHSSSHFNWAGRVRCTAPIQLWGRAYLVQSARHYVQYGQYFAPQARAAYSSGGQITVNGHPSVYVFHGLNMKLLPSQQDDTIVGVVLEPGTRISGASHCHVTNFTALGPIGAHCDLYSTRF